MITISALNGTPTSIFEELENFTKEENIEFHSETRESQAMAGLEDFLPAAVMIYIAKPFFDSYLSKAGEDAYLMTKKVFSKLIESCRSLPFYEYSSGKQKIDRKSPNSRKISLHIQRLDGQPVKILIPKELSKNETELMIECLFIELEKYYSNDDSCLIKEELDKNKSRGQSLVYYESSTKRWHSKSLNDIAQEQLKAIQSGDGQ
jgi:hypothetical protein